MICHSLLGYTIAHGHFIYEELPPSLPLPDTRQRHRWMAHDANIYYFITYEELRGICGRPVKDSGGCILVPVWPVRQDLPPPEQTAGKLVGTTR